MISHNSAWIHVLIGISAVQIVRVNSDPPSLSPQCPEDQYGEVTLRVMTTSPAFALAKCYNGDKSFVSRDASGYYLVAVLDKGSDDNSCQFYKQNGHLYTLDVEIGWGDDDSHTITHKRIHTLACAYDSHGKSLSISQKLTDGQVSGDEKLKFKSHQAGLPEFELSVLDVSDEVVLTDSIYLGKKIRLRAVLTSNAVHSFRALSCVAKNGATSYAILKSGCGDGTVIKKTLGFQTIGKEAISPYFDAFQLKGGETIQFMCNFTECTQDCNGDSCLEEIRRRQRLTPEQREREDSACMKAEPNLLIINGEEISKDK